MVLYLLLSYVTRYTLEIQRWWRLLSGLSLRLLLLLLAFTLTVSCSNLNPLKLLTGSGPNVAANTQIGKNNNQTVGVSSTNAPSVSVRPNARVDTVDQSTETVINQQLPTWVWIVAVILFIVGWVTDTPATFMKNLRMRKRNK